MWDVDTDRRASPRRRHIRVILDRRSKGWPFYPMVVLCGRQMFKRNLQKTLKVLARTSS
jgi:hypothetical protein